MFITALRVIARIWKERWHLNIKKRHYLRIKTQGKQNIFSILISDQINFKSKLIRRNRERRYRLNEEESHQKYIAIIFIYAQNISTPAHKNTITTTRSRQQEIKPMTEINNTETITTRRSKIPKKKEKRNKIFFKENQQDW